MSEPRYPGESDEAFGFRKGVEAAHRSPPEGAMKRVRGLLAEWELAGKKGNRTDPYLAAVRGCANELRRAIEGGETE